MFRTPSILVVTVQDLVWTQKNQHRLLMQHDINSGADSGLVSTVRLIVMAPGMAYKLRACSLIDRTANLMCKALVDVIDERGGVMRVRQIAGMPDGPMDPLDIARMILSSLPPELRALFYLHVKALRHCDYHEDGVSSTNTQTVTRATTSLSGQATHNAL